MHAGSHYTLKEAVIWTSRDIFRYLIIATIVTVPYELLGWKWLSIPWIPMTLIGTAVAFLIGFKNNASYDRTWEARKIWGALVNSSRTWGIMVKDFVNNDHAINPVSEEELKKIHTRLMYRHMAWLAALRYQLRTPRKWESMHKKHYAKYHEKFKKLSENLPLEEVLAEFLSEEECPYVLSKKNRATQIIALQSKELKELKQKGLIEDFRHMEMENVLSDFYVHQGKSERIKNFPYPRQFATLNRYFVWLFLFLLPLGLVQEFDLLSNRLPEYYAQHLSLTWVTIPFSTLVSWVFHTMEKIGESSENPFQGGANDIPITSLSRTIEIDLRDMLDEDSLPEPIGPYNNILM